MSDRDKLEIPELTAVAEHIAQAIAAPKCHKCGCLHATVEALSRTEAGKGPLAPVLAEARSVFVPRRYDCLGCAICYPALAANALAEAFPGEGLDLCPTEEPDVRAGWPPLPGDYEVIRYGAPVAVCTLNSEELTRDLAQRRPDGLAIAGTMHTENLGIERVIKNTLANPEIRFLVLCGDDTQQVVGHLPGQSLMSLFENGVDERGRIIGARGKRPVLRNITADEIRTFVDQVQPAPMIGEHDLDQISLEIMRCAGRSPGCYATPYISAFIERIQADEAGELVLDPAGYFVIYPDHASDTLVVEHYTNKGVLDYIIEGRSTGPIYTKVIECNLISRLDHAAYLGRELARAEAALRSGTKFVQDAAPGAIASPVQAPGRDPATTACCAPPQIKAC